MRIKHIALVTALLIAASSALIGETAVSSEGRSFAPQPAPTATQKPAGLNRTYITFAVGEYDGIAFTKTDAEWKKLLTAGEFYILREEGTETAYTGSLLKNKRKGTYHCAACGLALFSSAAKYESDTGWPSFFKPIFKKNVTEKADKSLAEERVEIECAQCGSHIGHVFDDGPQPTGLRYCMNSVALKFKPGK